MAGEVDILGAQAAAFQDPQAGAVEQASHQLEDAVEPLEHRADFLPAQDDGQSRGPLGADDVVEPGQVNLQHLAVQEEEGAQRLVLGGGGNSAVDGQGGEKRRDLRGTHLGRVPLAVEEDVALDPLDVGLLRLPAVVAGADGRPHPVEQPGGGRGVTWGVASRTRFRARAVAG